jgi:hypothetical protein
VDTFLLKEWTDRSADGSKSDARKWKNCCSFAFFYEHSAGFVHHAIAYQLKREILIHSTTCLPV